MGIIGHGGLIFLLNLISTGVNAWKNEGREFGIAFPPMYSWSTNGICQLIATSKYSGSLTVSYLGSDYTYSVNPKKSTVFNITTSVRPITNGYSSKAVYVTSTVDISLYAFTYYGSSGGMQSGFLLHPMLNDSSYFLHTRSESHNSNQPHAYFTAVAMDDNTTFLVYLPVPGGGYDFSYSFILNKGEVYCSSSPTDGDFNAIKITASKRAFITSGHANLMLFVESIYRTQAVGSLIYPSSVLRSEYLVPGIAGTDVVGGKIKVIAVQPGDTTVTRNGANAVSLKEGQGTEFSFTDQTVPSYITCSQACSVALYTLQDNTGNYAGSIQFPLVPKDFFVSQNVTFATPETEATTRHFISIVVLGTSTDEIFLDDSSVSTWTTVTTTTDVYSHATVSVTKGYHSISAPHFFMVYLYGHFQISTYGMSYGYPIALHDFSYYATAATTTPSYTSSVSTNASTTTVSPPSPGNCGNDTLCVAFSVGRNSPQSTTGVIFYDVVVVNDGNGFDVTTSSFDAPASGLYWFASSSGVPNATKSDQYLVGVDRLSRLSANTAINNGVDTVSRDGQFYLSGQCSAVQTIALYPVFSDAYLQTSLSGFNMYSVTEASLVASFSVALSKPLTCATGARVPFDVVLLDTLNKWDSVAHEYTTNEYGSYVISITAGSQPNRQLAMGLYVTDSSTVITVAQLGSTNEDYNLAHQLVIVDLDKDQRLYAGCLTYSTSYLHSSADYETMLHGFLYKPKLAPLLWSVATSDDFTGYRYPVEFPVSLTNRVGGWNPVRHRYEVVDGGVYYLHITAGSIPYERLQMDILLNGTPILNIYREANEHNGLLMRSRAFIWRLSKDDYLDVAGYSLIGNSQRITTFSGFRLYV